MRLFELEEHSPFLSWNFSWTAIVIAIIVFLIIFIAYYNRLKAEEYEYKFHFWGTRELSVIITSLMASSIIFILLCFIL